MSDSLICVPVTAASAAEMLERIEQAAAVADVVEIRFDSLPPAEAAILLTVLRNASFSAPLRLIATYRSAGQGALSPVSDADRQRFWSSADPSVFWASDIETDLAELTAGEGWRHRIVSEHDFRGIPDDLPTIFEQMAAARPDSVKIAVSAADATDGVDVFKLFANAVAAGVGLIPIAMGRSGAWTRILGPAHGATLTYASFGPDSGTAPGQFSPRDLIDVYRVRELDLETKVYGLIAGNTAYSVSPHLHNAAFRDSGTNAVFVPFEIKDLAGFVRRMVAAATREVDLNFGGFAVTNPHKQDIIDFLDAADGTVGAIGAANTVRIEGRRLVGFNTDADGFIGPLERRLGSVAGARVAVVGAGGAARACVYALRSRGADVTVFARDRSKADGLAGHFEVAAAKLDNGQSYAGFDVLVNSTPVGTRGAAENETVAEAEQLVGLKAVYDLVYNPLETRLLNAASEAGVTGIGGLEMLVAQAVRQFELWTGGRAPVDLMANAAKERLVAA